MLVSVTLHRAKGRQLKRAEIAPPVLGDLEWCQHTDTTHRRIAHTIAHLFRVDGAMPYAQPLLKPLFDPRIDKIEGQTLVIVGTELTTADGQFEEHMQVWACTPVTPDAFQPYSPREQHKPYVNRTAKATDKTG